MKQQERSTETTASTNTGVSNTKTRNILSGLLPTLSLIGIGFAILTKRKK